MAKLLNFLGKKDKDDADSDEQQKDTEAVQKALLHETQQENLQQDISILDDTDGETEQRLRKTAEKEVQSAAEDSLKRLLVVQLGLCPSCGEHLHQQLGASICDACGWHTFDGPSRGPVRVHLRSGRPPIEGERCYVVKDGYVLVLKQDLVVAKVPRDAYDYVEYIWAESEVQQRQKQLNERLQIACGWCNKPTNPEQDGFHLVHVALGSSQERYCFCSDECYEAFRKMYPARVHRDCYERDCEECNLCLKRYGNVAEGLRMLAKDYIAVKKKEKQE